MKSSQKEIIINHDAKDLYNIVIDIEKYPEFIPWCSNIIITDNNDKLIIADMYVNYKFFPTQKFTSKVFYNKKKLIINTNYMNGPLKDLKTEWIFKRINKSKTKVLFNINFEFEKLLHQKLAEIFFPLIENTMIDSFKKRSDDLLN
ncbi:MAG: Persistence and stress-resistance toxin PasT [Alphaproteobacteria bacterium MarineAlpha5_Bin6]|nr:MAG: Persistence and stress-resistance toxin PasT [Alphaproteobacteria bacterium MarineAlpha5_Bin7]PPR53659.1 MAG: Persistence and stress-resistance toxin PasT [Alphaproteobacteria bacterium MarineAlpha5_Bin6]|tara:strand:+ start:1232 stop:1669 length:438 start_codon:yes stop_codon:yes gene_type:complete